MPRESLNLTLTADLRKLDIKPRLNRLAARTGYTSATIAGRALTMGLAAIEADPTRMFPGSAMEPTAETAVAPQTAITCNAPQGTAQHHDAPQATPKPSKAKHRFLSAESVARVLGYRTKGAFLQHVFRNPDLRRFKHQEGKAVVWDVEQLRAEYAQQGWSPQ